MKIYPDLWIEDGDSTHTEEWRFCSPRRRKTMASTESSSSARKVVVLLRATGDAPILKQTKFKMPGTDKFIKVIDYIRRSIQRDTLFVFVNSAFSPGPDETVIDLYNKFGIDGKLVVNYACSMAWG
ncbi:unnamed protein product [Citrullus colocynthis]|uniref:Ubiquitin-like protein ATG12 n=1 Tax=Citrullus colocynthis TaxID=252529 RepID=A0ABP0Z186_9ROSI